MMHVDLKHWETNFAGKIGLGVAVDYAMQLGMDAIWQRIQSFIATQLRKKLAQIPGVVITQDIGTYTRRHCHFYSG